MTRARGRAGRSGGAALEPIADGARSTACGAVWPGFARAVAFALLVAATLVAGTGAALAGVQRIEFRGHVLDVFVPDRLTPRLSADGYTLYDGRQPRIVIADPEPAVPGERIPAPAFVAAGDFAAATTTSFVIDYVAAGGKDPWNQPCFAFPDTAKAVFSAAAAVWAGLLQSSVPIRISACWADLGSVSTLGYSGGGPMHRNFTNAPIANTWYSGALANSLAGSDLAASSYDMHITFNQYFTWYYGTDGAAPGGQMDMMSVVLHEVGHGLDFSGTADVNTSTGVGSWGGGSGYPGIYDRFAYSGGGTAMLDTATYPNNSVALGSLLKSGSVYFRGTNAMAANTANASGPVKLYAPSTWYDGSSFSHLDYATFAGTANRLMVYAISSGSSIHDPGPVALGMLQDMGWTRGTSVSAPTVTTGAASGVGVADATLNGTVSSNGAATTVTFQYGLTASYGSSATATQSPLASGASGSAVSAAISSLTCGTTYHFRVVAQNSSGTTNGSDATFATGACPGAFAKTSPASGSTGNPVSTTLTWGTSTGAASYDYCYDTTNDNACSTWVSTGTATSANLPSLSPGTTYYWQVRANNAGGSTYANGAATAFWSFATAASSTPPSATTNAATGVTAGGATLNGSVSSNGSTTTVTFQYGLTTGYGTTTVAAESPLAAGASNAAVSAAVSNLSCATTYHFRVVATNAATTNGSDQTFTTAACPGAFAKTSPASGATGVATSITLSWGASTGATAYEYCFDTSNDNACSAWVANGSATTVNLTGLAAATTYYWQVRATNAGGATYANAAAGAFWSFTTAGVSAPAATTGSASGQSATGATLNGTVSSNGAATTVSFQYGLTTGYGSNATAAQSPLASGASGSAVSAAISSLTCGTTYHFRVVAQNSAGTTNGADQTFATSACSPGVVGVSPATLAFGGQSMNTTSPAQAVTIANSGGSALTVTSVTASGPFAVTHGCATLAPGASCTASVTFTPNAQGALAGTLTVASSVGSATAALSGTGERSLVTHYYQSILRRAPDSGGKAYWEGIAVTLPTWGASINETWYAMAMTFYFSAEYQSLARDNAGFVTDLYRTFFNREPDAGGLAYWSGLLAGGMPREVILASFMFSDEFKAFTQAIFGSTAARPEVDVVMDFYRGLLARLPDKSGFDYWLGKLRTAQCQGAGAVVEVVDSISRQFLESGEYVGRGRSNSQFVGDLYNAFLRRGGDAAGVSYWVTQLNIGAMTREQERQAFLTSPEFSSRVAAVIAAQCLL